MIWPHELAMQGPCLEAQQCGSSAIALYSERQGVDAER